VAWVLRVNSVQHPAKLPRGLPGPRREQPIRVLRDILVRVVDEVGEPLVGVALDPSSGEVNGFAGEPSKPYNTTKTFAPRSDAPSQPLFHGDTRVEVVDEMRSYLMYRAEAPGSIWVSVGFLHWGWTGLAELDPATQKWKLLPLSMVFSKPATIAPSLPTWNGSYATTVVNPILVNSGRLEDRSAAPTPGSPEAGGP